jgi:hypothetical protein
VWKKGLRPIIEIWAGLGISGEKGVKNLFGFAGSIRAGGYNAVSRYVV